MTLINQDTNIERFGIDDPLPIAFMYASGQNFLNFPIIIIIKGL